MPYPKDHKPRTRRRIVECAGRLFGAQGFEATSIEQIMLACQLTRGAFYAHFPSKGELYREAIGGGARHGENGDWPDASQWGFLAADVASKDPEVRSAYASALKILENRLRLHSGTGAPDDSAALASAAMVVGALAIGMTVDDSRLKNSLADACREHARQLLVPGTEQAFLWAVSTG
ncbi:MAG: TetR/AcrR family transcriptional regulator [Burkholderiales bacterium]|nr:TetR/AcrR family transcriptional regulator [Burkholderiales bacterium]